MRSAIGGRVRLGALLAFALVGLATASGAAEGHRAAAPQIRVLYASDWSGPMEIFAADPSGRAPVRQLTFDPPARSCSPTAVACGYTQPQPSPDGRWLAYWGTGQGWEPRTLWLARADGTDARRVASAFAADWAPDSRRLAYSAEDGIHILSTSGADRVVDKRRPSRLRWSPDGRTLAFVDKALVLLRARHERILIHGSLESFAWGPDGRRIAYWTGEGLSIVSTASGQTRLVYRLRSPEGALPDLELAFSPNGRLLAFTSKLSPDKYGPDGTLVAAASVETISLLDLRTLRVRALRAAGHDLAWAPDGSRLLYVRGGVSSNAGLTPGDVQTVTTSGCIRTVASAAAAYGGQIVAAAWVTPPRGVRYRAPQPVDGVFAGGPVQELAADGRRVAFLACGGVWAWSTALGSSVAAVERRPVCRAPYGYETVYSLALAGDRLVWVEKRGNMGFGWDAKQATLTSPPALIGHGTGVGGTVPPDGLGTAAAAGSLLVMSAWSMDYASGTPHVDRQTIERVEPGGALTPLSTTPGPYTVLDVDGGRIVASGTNETRILDADGAILLSLPVPTLAAQLSGPDLVLAAGDQLRVYDAATGALRATWPLPAQPVGHDCDGYYGDPSCKATLGSIRLTLDDLARGLAAYVFDGQVHVLRLADGADRSLAAGTLAHFTDSGLAFADGARIRLLPFEQLQLH